MSKKLISIAKSKYFLLGLGLVLILTGLIFFLSKEGNDQLVSSRSGVDLIQGQDWSHLPGAKQTPEGIAVTPLDRAIVNQDGSKNQQNPPVNVRGPQLITNGSFRISASFKNLPQQGAFLQMYTEPPRIYDEWRYETPSLRLGVFPDSIKLTFWDGTSDKELLVQPLNLSTSDSRDVSLDFTHGSLTIYANNQKVGDIPTSINFLNSRLWFGLDAGLGGSGWTITKLMAEPLGNSAQLKIMQAPDLTLDTSDPTALKNTSKKPFGAAVALYPLLTNETYRNLAIGQFSMWTPENEMKAQFIHPQPNIYTFEDADSLVDIALQNHIAVHGHALVFGEANPQWMQDTAPVQLEKVMTDHVSTIVGHYKGRVSEWDVVNEPLAEDIDEDTVSPMRQHIWYKAMGVSYIAKAFSAARQADPTAKLYINEYGLEEDGPRWDTMVSLLKNLKSQGVPIDGVGFQAHVYEKGDLIDAAVLQKHIQQLANMGLVSRISEMDVYGDSSSTQANQYSSIYASCQLVATCQSFSTWGFTDAYGSTTELHEYPLSFGNDLLWDENFNPKPAVTSIIEQSRR